MTKEKTKPLFKYIGGKSWLRDELRKNVSECLTNKKLSTYVEPFAGGLGSFLSVYDILLENNVKNVILSDINEKLIFTYKIIKDNPEEFIKEFLLVESSFVNCINKGWKNIKDKNELKINLKEAERFFNKIKKEFNVNKNIVDVKQSARLVFLQKHAFNGVYRENSKGDYNTPFNWSGSNMLDNIEMKVKEMNILFNKFNLQFINQSFELIEYNEDTLYYLDPPYINEEIGENKYNKDIFSIDTQITLINKIKDVSFIYSNHKSEILLKELNKISNLKIQEINRKNIMSSSSESRKQDKIEILVTRYI